MKREPLPAATMLTARQAAELLGISVRSFYRLNDFFWKKKGRGSRWSREELDKVLATCRVAAGEPSRWPKQPRVTAGKYITNQRFEALLKISNVIANKTKFPYSGPAVYFLFQGDELVYIGQTVNLLARVASHFGRKGFDHFSHIICDRSELAALERIAIVKYRPKLNLA